MKVSESFHKWDTDDTQRLTLQADHRPRTHTNSSTWDVCSPLRIPYLSCGPPCNFFQYSDATIDPHLCTVWCGTFPTRNQRLHGSANKLWHCEVRVKYISTAHRRNVIRQVLIHCTQLNHLKLFKVYCTPVTETKLGTNRWLQPRFDGRYGWHQQCTKSRACDGEFWLFQQKNLYLNIYATIANWQLALRAMAWEAFLPMARILLVTTLRGFAIFVSKTFKRMRDSCRK